MHLITPELNRFERKIHSQFGEDGVIAEICRCLGIVKGTFFEFGIGPRWQAPLSEGLEGNCVLLRKAGWTGVFMDGCAYPAELGVHQNFVNSLNINRIWRELDLPQELDCISIDVDGQEYWIWEALDYDPKIVIVEYNGGLGSELSVTMPLDLYHVWDGTCHHGASLRALDRLASQKSYTLVYANGVNAMFIRNDLIANPEDFQFDEIFRPYASHAPDRMNRAWKQIE